MPKSRKCTKNATADIGSYWDDDGLSPDDFNVSDIVDSTADGISQEMIQLDVKDLASFQLPMLRAYLAGPMTCLDLFSEKACRDIRSAEKTILQPCFHVYDPADVTPCGSSHTNPHVHCVDHLNTRDADLILYHLKAPSVGLGMEAQIATFANVPGVLIIPRGETVSRMLLGCDSLFLAKIFYSDVADFSRQLSEELPKIMPQLELLAKARRRDTALISRSSFGRNMLRLRILQQMSRSELAAASGVAEGFLLRLEGSDRWIKSLSLMQAISITAQLNMTVALSRSGPSYYNQDENLEPRVDRSLDALVDFIREEEVKADSNLASPSIISDRKIFRLWSDFQQMSTMAIAGREPTDGIYDVEVWRQLYEQTLF